MAGYAKTPLCEAILMDDPQESYEMVKALLEAGEDPNQPDEWIEFTRPVYVAWGEEIEDAKNGFVKLLIDYGAQAHPKDQQLDVICICHAPIESTLLIFRLGHSFNEYITKWGSESLCEDNPLTYLLNQDRLDLVEALKPFDLMCLLNAFNSLGLTPLAEMARDGKIDKAQWLLDQRADVNAQCERWVGDTALDEAVSVQNADMVRVLIDAGANPNIPTCMSVTAAMRAEIELKEHKTPKTKEIAKLVAEASKRFPVQSD